MPTHVSQNVGKIWIGQIKTFPASFWAISCNFLHGQKNQRIVNKYNIFLGGPMGPESHLVSGHVLVCTKTPHNSSIQFLQKLLEPTPIVAEHMHRD